MMKFFSSVVFLSLVSFLSFPSSSFLLSSVSGAPSCANPMFASPLSILATMNSTSSQMVPRRLNLRRSPVTYTSSVSCVNVFGGPSCCSPSSDNQAAVVGNKHAANAELVVQLHQMNPDLAAIFLNNAFGQQFTRPQIEFLRSTLVAVQPMLLPGNLCSGGIAAYESGMYCFACDPNWANFYDRRTGHLKLDLDSCDRTYATCDEFFYQLQIALPKVLEAYRVYVLKTSPDDEQRLNGISIFLLALKNGQSVCRIGTIASSCKRFLCDVMLHGADLNATLPNVPFTSPLNPRSLEKHTMGEGVGLTYAMRRLLSAVDQEQVNGQNKLMSALIGNLAGWVQPMVENDPNSAFVMERMAITLRAMDSSTSSDLGSDADSVPVPESELFSNFSSTVASSSSLIRPHIALDAGDFDTRNGFAFNDYVAVGGFAAYGTGCRTGLSSAVAPCNFRLDHDERGDLTPAGSSGQASNSSGSDQLSGGAVVAIVVLLLAGASVSGGAAFWWYRRQKIVKDKQEVLLQPNQDYSDGF